MTALFDAATAPTSAGAIQLEAASGRTRHEAVVVVATTVVSLLNYGYTMALIWMLPVYEYAVVGSISALLLICGTVAGASSPWVLAREVATARDDADRRRRAVSFCLLTSLAQAFIAALATCAVALHYADAAALAATFASVLIIFTAATTTGYLQGREQFPRIAVLRVGEVVVKIGAGLTLVAIGFGAGGAIAGFALGAGLVAAGGLWAMRSDLRWVRGSLRARHLWLDTRGLMAIQAGAAVLATLDVVLASLLIANRSEVGTYQAAQILGRIPVYVGTALSMVVFPRLVAGHRPPARSIRQILHLFVRVCVPIAIVVGTLPPFICHHLFPPSYGDIAGLLPWAAAAGLAMGAVNLITTFFQAAGLFGRTTAILGQGLVVAAATEVVGLHLWGLRGLALGVALAGSAVAFALLRDARHRWPSCTVGIPRAALITAGLALPLAALRNRPALWLGWAFVFAGIPTLVALFQLGSDNRSGDKPRVLHLGFEDPRRPGAGGGSVRTHEVNRVLADEFDITVVCARYPGARTRVDEGVRYVHVGLPWGEFPSVLAYFAAIPWALWRYASDLVVEDFAAPFSTLGVPRMTRRPVVGVVQWLFAAEKTRQYHLPFARVERYGLATHRHLIAVSEELADELRRRQPAAEVVAVANGLDAGAFGVSPRPRADIAYLGRLEIAQKGLDLLLEAYAESVHVGRIDQRLILGGDGPDRARLEAMAERLGIADRVVFAGRIRADERFDWLASADFVVMPSRFESFGMVAAEALAVATPVVAFDIACLRALVTDEVGVVVPAFDVAGLSRAITGLARDADLRVRLGTAGPATIADLRWDRLARRQGSVYRRVLDAQQATTDLRSGPEARAAEDPVIDLVEPTPVIAQRQAGQGTRP